MQVSNGMGDLSVEMEGDIRLERRWKWELFLGVMSSLIARNFPTIQNINRPSLYWMNTNDLPRTEAPLPQ